MPRPSTDTNVIPVIDVTVLTLYWCVGVSPVMSVPAKSGAKVFLIRIGIFSSTAGMIVCGCNTFAPKYDISADSLYETRSSTRAPGTLPGAAVMTPLTSAHIWSSSALIQLPTTDSQQPDTPLTHVA